MARTRSEPTHPLRLRQPVKPVGPTLGPARMNLRRGLPTARKLGGLDRFLREAPLQEKQ